MTYVEAKPFTPRGVKSIVDACMDLIQETEEKDGVSYDVAVTEIRLRTGLDDLRRDDLMDPMRKATDRLHVEGIPGVMNIRGAGWQRLDPRGMVAYVATRTRRGRRQFRRAVTAVGATDKSRLDFQDRNRLDHHEHAARMIADLDQRRAQKRRPLPPASGE